MVYSNCSKLNKKRRYLTPKVKPECATWTKLANFFRSKFERFYAVDAIIKKTQSASL